MGNSLRKGSKTSPAQRRGSKIVRPDSVLKSPGSSKVDRVDEREMDFDSDDDDDEDERQMRNFKQKVISTSPFVQARRWNAADRRQYSEPATPVVGCPSTSEEDFSVDEEEIAKMLAKGRSKSIGGRKIRSNKSSSNLPKQAGSVSVRPRRASESPAIAQKDVNGSTSGDGLGKGQLQLTIAQINLVRKLWQHVRVQGENGPGISILRQHLFFRCPAVRQLFATDLEGTQSEMCYHKRLQNHAEVLSELLDELVNNLERAHIVKEKLRHWGRLHADLRQIGFSAALWDRFAESLNDCTLTWCQKAQRCFEAQVAWTTIVLYITEQLKEGYYQEIRRLRKEAYAASRIQNTTTDHNNDYGASGGNRTTGQSVSFADVEDFDDEGL